MSFRNEQNRELRHLVPLSLDPAQLTRITVCTRPFRAQGPRVEAERLGDKLLVHNYGHGGSGWSLSWGTAAAVVQMAFANGVEDIAVVGCGAIGLTSAISLQRAGARVTIYARELPAETRSARATGTWTPDARFALRDCLDGAGAARWERFARDSFAEFDRLLRLPDRCVELHDRYTLSELSSDEAWQQKVNEDPIGFARLETRIADLYPVSQDFGPGEHPFASRYCRHTTGYRFHIAAYSRFLEAEFRERGGVIRRVEFHSASELTQLKERIIVHCTGYGARTILDDDSLIPVRGQISWLPAQPHPYSVYWNDLIVVPRSDGTVVQWGAQGDATGWQDASELPDEAEARMALTKAASLCAGMKYDLALETPAVPSPVYG